MKVKHRGVRLVLSLVSLWLLLLPVNAGAQESIQVTDSGWTAEFRDNLTFTVKAESQAEIVEAQLFYRIVGRPATSRNEAEFTPGASLTAQFVIDQTKPENYLPPGTELEYWWKLVDAAGTELKTERETLLYLDNRYDWQTLENERLTLYWYEGGDSFGQALFDRANLALDTLEKDAGVAIEDPIKIFIYGNHNDLLGAISTTAQEWTGGQAFTLYGVVVIGIAPGQLNWGLEAMTHEMTHLVIHQATENPYGDLPRWLDEGLAVYNENQAELPSDFRSIFEEAVRNDELMTLRTLSSPFPADPMQANLAYGQSGAVVKFIIDTYGREAMARLLDVFSEGAIYDEALQEALGVDTDGLDNAFRASLGLPPLPGTEINTAVEAKPEEETAAESESAATPAGNGDHSAGAKPQEPAKTSQSGGPPLGLPCLAGLLPLLALSGVALRRPA
ncbi:MAG: peptidase MA family metallohydrolase [Chloroflexota bacterium]